MKNNKQNHQLLFFIFMNVFFTHSVLAGTATIGSQNGFNASISGNSSSGQANSSLDDNQKLNLKSKDVFALKSLETINESSHIQIQDLFLKSYKRLIQGMIQNNILSLESLKQVIEGKDYFFFLFFKENLDVNKNIYKNAFLKLYNHIKINGEDLNLIPTFVEYLNAEIKLLQIVNGVKQDSLSGTEEVFLPKITKKVKSYKKDVYKYAVTNQGKGFLVSFKDIRTMAVHDARSGNFLYDVHVHFNLSQNNFSVKYLENENKYVLFFIDQYRLIVIDLETNTQIHKINLEDYSFRTIFDPEILELTSGQKMFLFNSLNTTENNEQEHLMNFYDYHSGKKIHSPFRVNSKEDFLNRYILKREDGQTVIVSILSNYAYFIDPLTGAEIQYTEKNSITEKIEQKKAKKFITESNTIGSNSFFKNSLGQDILVLTVGSWIFFIDPFTGREIYRPIATSFNHRKSNPPLIFNTENGKTVVVINHSESLFILRLKFVDLETNSYVFYKISIDSQVTFAPILFKSQLGKNMIGIKPDHESYLRVYDIETGLIENQFFIQQNRSSFENNFLSTDRGEFIEFIINKNKVSFLDIHSGVLMDTLSFEDGHINNIYFFENSNGFKNSGFASVKIADEVFLYFFSLSSRVLNNEEGLKL